MIDLSQAGLQIVRAGRLSLILSDGTTFEKVIGSSQSDQITGNGQANILLGMAGNDLIQGGLGRDLLIGGTGSDTIDGGTDDDLLMVGTTTYDAIPSSLEQVLSEWNGPNSYASRIANLRSGAGGLPALIKGSRVKKDSAPNAMTGSTGNGLVLC